jgi:hypothetical protein
MALANLNVVAMPSHGTLYDLTVNAGVAAKLASGCIGEVATLQLLKHKLT